MLPEHPRGAKRFLGPPLLYLIHRDHGCLGAAGFAAAVLRLAARDTWMGWMRPSADGTCTGSWGETVG